jgi:TonB family protein
MGMLSILNLMLMLGSLSVADPAYPLDAISGGTVVARLHFASGTIQNVEILSGRGSFADSCKSAFKEWHSDQDGDELVIVHFRQPYLYFLGDRKESFKPATIEGGLPYPLYIIQPLYPPNALARGSVVLRVDISAKGDVSKITTIKSVGGLTESSIEAVQKWKFKPAEDAQGKATPSHAYAVLVYRFPVLTEPAK